MPEQHNVKTLISTAKNFGARVEKAADGRYNFFSHPEQCAFGAPLPQTSGEFDSRREALIACGRYIIEEGFAKPYDDEPYQGWRNSATFLANQYVTQERKIYETLVLSCKSDPEKFNLKKTLVERLGLTVFRNRSENVDENQGCGLSGQKIRLDSWAKGDIDWNEIQENFTSELGMKSAKTTDISKR